MADKITQKDVIDSSVVKEISKLNTELTKSVKLMIDLTKEAIAFKNANNPQNIQQVVSSQKELGDIVEKSTKADKERISTVEKLRKKTAELNIEEEKAKIAYQEKKKAIRDLIKAQKNNSKETIILTRELQKQVKTEREAAAQNKKLLAIRKDLTFTNEKDIKQRSLINKKIDENNKLIKNNVSKLEEQKIGIGQYKEGVSDALEEQEFFGISINKISSAFKTGAGIVGAVTATIVGLGKAYASSARGAEDMARASDRLNTIAKSLGNTLADATGDSNLFDNIVRSLQEHIFGLAKTMESDVQVAILSTIRQLETLELEQEAQKKSQLNRSEILRQIRDDERNSYEERKAANDELGRVITERENETINFQKEKLKNYKTLLAFDENNIEIQRAIKQIEFEIADAEEEAQGFRSEQKMNDMALSREYAANEIELQKTVLEGKIAAAKEGSAEEFRLKQELINKTRELELQAAGENEQLRQIAIEKARNSSAELRRIKIDEKIGENEDILELIEEQNESELESLDEKLEGENEIILEKLEELNEEKAEKYKEDADNAKQADAAKKQSIKEYIAFAAQQAQQLTSSIVGYQQAELDYQMKVDLQKAESRGASEAEIEKIEKKYAQKRKKLKMTEAIINTALGVVNMLATVKFPLNIVMAALVGAMGAIEVATISKQSFAKGTKDSGSEWLEATVAEKGTERINLADGTSFYTPNKQTKMLLPPHSEVIPNHQLQNELAEVQMLGGRAKKQQQDKTRDKQHNELISTIKNKKEVYFNITENGIGVTAKKGNTFYKYLGRKYRD